MRVIIIRHGDPEYKEGGLTIDGHKQAAALAKKLYNEPCPIRHIFSSPMKRALITAEYSAKKLGLNVHTVDWMRELNYWGAVEEELRTEVQEQGGDEEKEEETDEERKKTRKKNYYLVAKKAEGYVQEKECNKAGTTVIPPWCVSGQILRNVEGGVVKNDNMYDHFSFYKDLSIKEKFDELCKKSDAFFAQFGFVREKGPIYRITKVLTGKANDKEGSTNDRGEKEKKFNRANKRVDEKTKEKYDDNIGAVSRFTGMFSFSLPEFLSSSSSASSSHLLHGASLLDSKEDAEKDGTLNINTRINEQEKKQEKKKKEKKEWGEREYQICVFCHGGFGLTWLAHLLDIPLCSVYTSFWLSPSSVTTVLFEERTETYAVPRCLCVGDTSHLYSNNSNNGVCNSLLPMPISKYERPNIYTRRKRPAGLKANCY